MAIVLFVFPLIFYSVLIYSRYHTVPAKRNALLGVGLAILGLLYVSLVNETGSKIEFFNAIRRPKRRLSCQLPGQPWHQQPADQQAAACCPMATRPLPARRQICQLMPASTPAPIPARRGHHSALAGLGKGATSSIKNPLGWARLPAIEASRLVGLKQP